MVAVTAGSMLTATTRAVSTPAKPSITTTHPMALITALPTARLTRVMTTMARPMTITTTPPTATVTDQGDDRGRNYRSKSSRHVCGG